MIKVMVAEDERPISRSIVKAIESQNPKYSVEFVAHNGKQAKEFLDTEEIDVAFLDINMPIYDGLWLLEYINSCNLDIISVILTGYQEFEYAQRALKARAFDYILKPLNEIQLNEILHKINTELVRKNREMILQINADVPHHVFENPNGLNDRCWLASFFLGGCAKGDLLVETIEKQKQTEEYIYNFLIQQLGKNNFWIIDGHEISERILFMNEATLKYKEVLEELVKKDRKLVVPITIAVKDIPVEIKDINKIYKTLRYQAKNIAMFDKSVIRFVGEREKNGKDWIQQNEKLQDEKAWKLLLDGIWANATVDRLTEILAEMILSVGLERQRVEFAIKSFFIRLCEKVPTQFTYLDIEEEILMISENEFYSEGLAEKIRELIKKYFYVEIELAENREELARAMKEYMAYNYSFHFSNQILEEKFGYSAFYLRSVFKEAHGMSPNEYLLKVRMERAGELLKKNIQVKNVAEEVGFVDPLYFSKVFKKYMGCSPKEYKKH